MAAVSVAEEAPNWAKRDYSAPVNQVFAAALKSIQEQHHEVKSKDDTSHSVDFHVGITAWSWGYSMTLSVSPIDETHARVVVGVSRSGGKAVSWGSGRKEVIKILAGIDAELTGQTKETTRAVKVTVSSTPPNADIEIDGSFVGNTPSTLELAPGEHDIVIKKSGFQNWQRKMKIGGGAINISAELEKAP